MEKNAARICMRIADSILNTVVVITVAVMFSYGCYAIWDTVSEVSKATQTSYEKYKPDEGGQKSLSELQAVNSDVIGWLSIYGTNIDYPILQSDNNEKYLTADPEGNYSLSGSIFLDWQNSPSFTDFNSIIYGHHMAYHAMFGDISEFKDASFFDSHPYGNIYYDGKDHGIQLLAFLQVDAYSSSLYEPAVTDNSLKESYLDTMTDSAVNIRQMDISTDDHLILMSTCTEDVTNGRHILVGRITDETYTNDFAEDDAKNKSNSAIWGTVLSENQDVVPMMALIILLLLLAVILAAMIRTQGKRKKKNV